MKKQLLLSFIALFFGTFFAFSQTTPVCGGVFTDPAGATVNYANNSDYTITICPSSPGEVVTVTFTSFDVEANFDGLYVFNGSSISSQQISSSNPASSTGGGAGAYWGTTIPGPFTSSSPDGCLTFRFRSDNSVNRAGWVANVTCNAAPTCLAPTYVLATNVQSPTATIGWTENGNATQWEILVLPSGTIPSATSTGTITTVNPTTISSLNSATSVVYVRAICSASDISNWSIPTTITIPICASPTQLTTSGITQTSANLGWTNTTSSTSWQVAVQLASVTTLPTSGTVTNSNTNYLVSGLSQASTYKYYVRADCGNGIYSAWSSPLNFTTLAPAMTTPVCGAAFTDNGGLSANYYNNTDSTVTIYPTNPGDVVTVTFTSFNIEANYDGLYVFNGNSINSPQISSGNPAINLSGGLPGAFWGTSIPGPFTSSSTDGSLTFRLRSDSSVNNSGWVANITCGPAPTCSAPLVSQVTNINFSSAAISWTETGSASQWEVIVLPVTAPSPSASAIGTLTTSNSFNATGLFSQTIYKVYVRAVCSTTDFSNWSSQFFTTSACSTPSTTISNITSSGVTLNLTNTTTSTWEYILVPSGSPVPSDTTSGAFTNTFSNIINGLACSTSYVLYIKNVCPTGGISAWVMKSTFTTSTCTLTTGQPVNLTSCYDTILPCFDLTPNTPLILGNLNPSEYLVTYHDSATSAANQTVVLGDSYCAAETSRTLYAVLKNIATGQTQIFSFLVISKNTNTPQVLSAINQCDFGSNGIEVFDLTTIVTSVNPLNYYTSLTNASSQTAAITNPNTYSVLTSTNAPIIFIRETIANNCDNVYQIQLNVYANCNLAYSCNQANSLCGSLETPFANTHQNIQAEDGNDYGCLFTKPNPTWFYLPISSAGTINLTIQQNSSIDFTGTPHDVDYIIYGPFSNPTTPCSGGLTASNIVSCSYSSSATENPVIPNAQVGQYYLLMTTNFSNQAGFIRINLKPTSTGAIDCSGLQLNAFLDTNNNGTQETGESNFPLGQFHYDVNNGTVHNVTSPTGVYNIYDTNGTNSYNFNYTVDTAYSNMYSVTTSSYSNINVIIGGGMVTYNFPITTIQNYNDLAVTIIPTNSPRAGTTYKNKIVYANLGNQTISSGTLTFNNNTSSTISAISQTGTTPITNGFTYDFTNLQPFESRIITVTMSVPSIPEVSIGQLLTNTVSIIPLTGDIVPANNSSLLTQAIIAAYDPNDKTESHGEKIVFSTFSPNDYLYYTIRFENTGNAGAINIRVEDILDPRIDETSVVMVDASHPYTMDRMSTNLNWIFNNIQLPPSIENTDIGKGYITFKAKLKPGFTSGDIIPNTASIYFDTNPAIVTNTFNTEFLSALRNTSFDSYLFVVYPNPANTLVQIKLQNISEIFDTIKLTDILGKTIKTIVSISSNTTTLDISDVAKGIYNIEIATKNGLKENKKLIIN